MISSGNPTLDKNLECIRKYNAKLADDLLNLPHLSNEIDLIETALKEPNLTYNGTPLHSQEGAEEEAKKSFDKTPNSKTSVHIIFGLGIGHLFKEFCERSKGLVFLYEPNLEVLRVTLELVDFSKELSQNNVRICADMEDFRTTFTNSYKYKADALFIALKSYTDVLYADKIQDIVKQIETISGGCIADYNTLIINLEKSMEIMLDNLSYTLNETPLGEFKDFYKGKTALIISAGPTLEENIETIKQNRDKVVIFCVGTAYKALEKHGIKPDFVNIVEMSDCSSQIKDSDLSDINLILEPYTNTSIHKVKTRQKLIFPSAGNHANNYWAELTGVDNLGYETRGTVSFEALFSAKILGFSKIILVGQDLAYIDNQCYSSGAAYADLKFEINPETKKLEFKVEDINHFIDSHMPIGETNRAQYESWMECKLQYLQDVLYFVKSVKGEMLPTQAGYATFIDHFESFATRFGKDLTLINSSMKGAQINGFENIPLAEALKDETTIGAGYEFPMKTYPYDKAKIVKLLTEKQTALEKILKEIEPAKEYVFKYEREYNKLKELTLEAGRYFKLLLSLYMKINGENQDSVYQAASFNEQIEIEYVLRQTENVDAPSIELLYGHLKNYFQLATQNSMRIIEKLKAQIEIIKE